MNLGFIEPNDPALLSPEGRFATALHSALIKHRRISATASKNMWYRDFGILIDRHGEQEVENLLQWFIQNIDASFTPRPRSAKGFREQYDKIKQCMLRNGGTVELSNDGEVVIERIKRKFWPAGTEKQLAATVESSLQNYKSFYNRLVEVRDKLCKDKTELSGHEKFEAKRKYKLARHLVASYFGDPVHFVSLWFLRVNEYINRLDKFNGSLAAFVFKADNQIFMQDCHTWCRKYCHRETGWHEILELMEENK